MLTAIMLLYINIKYILTYLKTDNFSKKEYRNRKSTKLQVKILIGAVITDIIIVQLFYRFALGFY